MGLHESSVDSITIRDNGYIQVYNNVVAAVSNGQQRILFRPMVCITIHWIKSSLSCAYENMSFSAHNIICQEIE